VDIQSNLYVWTNSRWQHIQSMWSPARVIQPGQSSVTVLNSGMFTSAVGRFNGYYRVVMNVYWRNASTGSTLGSRVIDMVHAGDYGCQVFGNVRCSVGPGYLSLW
jgi:hypothetical protein